MTDLKSRIDSWRLVNAQGSYVLLTNYGARITGLFVPDRYGNVESVVLGFSDACDYLTDDCYLGTTIGPVANRISKGRYMLNGKEWVTDKNDGENTNHGGFTGFDKMIFDCEYCDSTRVIFVLKVNLTDKGFAANVSLKVSYLFDDDNTLRVDYAAVADCPTVLNITNHAYFNLTGCKIDISADHLLYINSELMLQSDSSYIPTGKILPVARSKYDFGIMRQMSEHGLRYNEYYILSQSDVGQLVAVVYSPSSGRKMEVRTSYPGLFFYSADFLSSKGVGWHGDYYKAHDGFCLEAQLYPDAANRPEFPSVELKAGQEYNHFISFRLYAE